MRAQCLRTLTHGLETQYFAWNYWQYVCACNLTWTSSLKLTLKKISYQHLLQHMKADEFLSNNFISFVATIALVSSLFWVCDKLENRTEPYTCILACTSTHTALLGHYNFTIWLTLTDHDVHGYCLICVCVRYSGQVYSVIMSWNWVK